VTRAIAGFGALIGAFALIVQYVILFTDMTAEGATGLAATWRYFGYFTILTNALVVAIWTAAALRPSALLNSARVEAMAAMAIVMVGVVYHLLLASRWNPQGWQLVADIIVHTVTPIWFVLYWLRRPHGGLAWSDAARCLVWPLGYCVYALTRGAFDKWYAYPFLDPTSSTISELVINIVGLSSAFAVCALVVVAADKWLGARGAISSPDAVSPARQP